MNRTGKLEAVPSSVAETKWCSRDDLTAKVGRTGEQTDGVAEGSRAFR